jgi:tetratricopeptide (TPR) repeat protein
LSAQAPEKNLFVDDVVTALTGPVDDRGHSTIGLKDQMTRAAAEFDQRTAEAFARALLEALCKEPIDLRKLEALLVLGLAHPTILEKHRISLDVEGRRLATMLENQGQPERARLMLDTIAQHAEKAETVVDKGVAASRPTTPVEQQIETHLRRADELASRGRSADAIRELQHVVTLDRNRRDVARMIRDLRWQEKDHRARNLRRLKIGAFVLAAAAVITGLVAREFHIDALYRAIPPASGDLASLRARLDDIDQLMTSNRVWVGLIPALREESRLREDIRMLELQASRVSHEAELAKKHKSELSEAARSRGMMLAEQGKFEEALADLQQALALNEPDWDQRKKVEADVKAIQAWMKKSR